MGFALLRSRANFDAKVDVKIFQSRRIHHMLIKMIGEVFLQNGDSRYEMDQFQGVLHSRECAMARGGERDGERREGIDGEVDSSKGAARSYRIGTRSNT